MLLFISHASEDQKDFVEPLANELGKVFDVWYAPYQLSLGDSLLQKIDEGLRSCDFGVVVLSQAFFSKKWPKAELDGLFALEGTSRKVILPVRKGLSPEDVAGYSPILGGRLSVSADEGLAKVVEEIRLAVDVSERKRQLTIVGTAAQKFKLLDQSLKEKKTSFTLLHNEEGVNLIKDALQRLFQVLQKTLNEISEQSEVVKFQCRLPGPFGMDISAPYRLTSDVRLIGLGGNYADEAVLRMRVVLSSRPHFNEQGGVISTLDFKPAFDFAKHVIWISEDDSRRYGTDELAGHFIDTLSHEIQVQSEEQPTYG